MIRTRKKYCIWAMAATFGLLSALNLGLLHAADVKWHPGVQRSLGALKTEVLPVGKHQLMRFAVMYCVDGLTGGIKCW